MARQVFCNRNHAVVECLVKSPNPALKRDAAKARRPLTLRWAEMKNLLILTMLIMLIIGCDKKEEANTGTLVHTHNIGQFQIEEREYWAGSSENHKNPFCNYYIKYNGKPLNLIKYGYINYYNKCDEIIVAETHTPAFIVWISTGSGGETIPLYISEESEIAVVTNFPPQCGYRDPRDLSDARKIMLSKSHFAKFCGNNYDLRTIDRWNVTSTSVAPDFIRQQ